LAKVKFRPHIKHRLKSGDIFRSTIRLWVERLYTNVIWHKSFFGTIFEGLLAIFFISAQVIFWKQTQQG